MAPPSTSVRLEEIQPTILPETIFIPFKPATVFLKNPSTMQFLKLRTEDAELARNFNGTRSLSQILRSQLENSGTSTFERILKLLIQLNRNGFLTPECAAALNRGLATEFPEEPLGRFYRTIKKLISFNILVFPRTTFSWKPLQFCAFVLSSYPGLALMALASLGTIISTSSFGNAVVAAAEASGTVTASSYALSLITLWLGICSLMTIKNFLSAYILSSRGCRAVKARIGFFMGLVYLDCDYADIVTKGEYGVLRLYGARILLPFALIGLFRFLPAPIASALPFVLILRDACLLVGIFSILPLTKTDMNNALLILTNATADFGQVIAYLRKRYFLTMSDFGSMAMRGLDYSIILVLLTIGWIAGFALQFYQIIMAAGDGLINAMTFGFSWNAALFLTQIIIILAPIIVLLTISGLIFAANVQTVFKGPIHRLVQLATHVADHPVSPGQETVRFIREIPLFAHLSEDDAKSLSMHMRLVAYSSGHTIILQGEKGDAFYLVVAGSVIVELVDEQGQNQVQGILSTGDSFGEIALIENTPRTASVRALTDTKLLRLERAQFEKFLAKVSGDKDRFTDMIRIGKLLMHSPLFAGSSSHQIRTIISRMKPASFKSGDVIFRQGEEGTRLYLIKEGRVEARRMESNKPAFSKQLGRGEWFGEIALVRNIPRTTDVVAATDCVLLALDKDDFLEIMQENLIAGVAFDNLVNKRMSELKPMPA